MGPTVTRPPNTARAYESDLRDFAAWCAQHGCPSAPAASADVAAYLRERSETLAPATVARRLAAIVDAHDRAGYPSPRGSADVRDALASIEWRHRARRRPTTPLDAESLSRMSLALPSTMAGARDRALLLVGYGAALRRTELVALDVDDADVAPDGALRLRTARGTISIPPGSQPHLSAGRAFARWTQRGALSEGPAFRPVDRYGNVGPMRLSDRAVTSIVQRAAIAAGLTARYSGRSLRLGMVLAAAAAGASDEGIIGQTGHRSVRLVREYRRARLSDSGEEADP